MWWSSRRLAERGYAVYNIDYRLASPGQPWSACAEEIASVSLLPFAARPGPRVLQTHAREDTVVPIASARNFAETYRRNGGDVTLYDYSRDDEPNCGGHCIWPKDVQPMRARHLLLLEKAIDNFMKGSR